ncbi:hypothetical protein PG996_008165 [Apiospora saccharicola]|uniref:Uncharacterized protein n=1 Tax=Apiospora saccharicola TaxID=335842 RepID=A0ABR1V0D0_9PEZI
MVLRAAPTFVGRAMPSVHRVIKNKKADLTWAMAEPRLAVKTAPCSDRSSKYQCPKEKKMCPGGFFRQHAHPTRSIRCGVVVNISRSHSRALSQTPSAHTWVRRLSKRFAPGLGVVLCSGWIIGASFIPPLVSFGTALDVESASPVSQVFRLELFLPNLFLSPPNHTKPP